MNRSQFKIDQLKALAHGLTSLCEREEKLGQPNKALEQALEIIEDELMLAQLAMEADEAASEDDLIEQGMKKVYGVRG